MVKKEYRICNIIYTI